MQMSHCIFIITVVAAKAEQDDSGVCQAVDLLHLLERNADKELLDLRSKIQDLHSLSRQTSEDPKEEHSHLHLLEVAAAIKDAQPQTKLKTESDALKKFQEWATKVLNVPRDFQLKQSGETPVVVSKAFHKSGQILNIPLKFTIQGSLTEAQTQCLTMNNVTVTALIEEQNLAVIALKIMTESLSKTSKFAKFIDMLPRKVEGALSLTVDEIPTLLLSTFVDYAPQYIQTVHELYAYIWQRFDEKHVCIRRLGFTSLDQFTLQEFIWAYFIAKKYSTSLRFTKLQQGIKPVLIPFVHLMRHGDGSLYRGQAELKLSHTETEVQFALTKDVKRGEQLMLDDDKLVFADAERAFAYYGFTKSRCLQVTPYFTQTEVDSLKTTFTDSMLATLSYIRYDLKSVDFGKTFIAYDRARMVKKIIQQLLSTANDAEVTQTMIWDYMALTVRRATTQMKGLNYNGLRREIQQATGPRLHLLQALVAHFEMHSNFLKYARKQADATEEFS